jgi:hypothetical protein
MLLSSLRSSPSAHRDRRQQRTLFTLRTLALSMLFTLFAAPAFAEGDKPVVLVQFANQVGAFTRNLPERAASEREIVQKIAAAFARRYAFADWRATAPAGRTTLGTLILRLQADASTAPSPRVSVLLYRAARVAGGQPVDLRLNPIEIYEPTNLVWDTNNRRAFETRLLTRTLATVGSDAFQPGFVERFVSTLPIASSVIPQPNERVIDVPVAWTQNLLAADAELVVRFDKSSRQGEMRLGNISSQLTRPENPGAPGNAFPARLRGSLRSAAFDSQPLPLDARQWNAGLPDLLRGARAFCFIAVYRERDALSPDDDLFAVPAGGAR